MSEYCNTVVFSNRAYNAIIDETHRKDPIETGGILLGYAFDNGIWVVMEVVPPGEDSIHQYAYFEYDRKFVNYLAESISTKYEKKLELLGLWHRHPGSMDTFSGTDDETNLAFARLSPRGAISGLVNVDPAFRLTMRHVSCPLSYETVAVEIGDELIPAEYFRLRHYPVKRPASEPIHDKKKDTPDTGHESGEKSDSGTRNKTTQKLTNHGEPAKIVALCLLVVFFWGMFLIAHYSLLMLSGTVCSRIVPYCLHFFLSLLVSNVVL